MSQRKIRNKKPFKLKVNRVGLRKSLFEDVNHRVLSASWTEFLFYAALIYLAVNSIFAFLYYIGVGSIINADPNSYWDAFVFSFQTSTTVGYGILSPGTKYANVIMFLDTTTGLLFVAIITGLAFNKFSRPTANIIFSNRCVVNQFYKKTTLMFRLANARDSHLANASISVVAIMDEVTPEGECMRRIRDLKLIRSSTPVFFMSWTVMHVIDKESPLFGLSEKELEQKGLRITFSVTGLDDWTAQSVHASHGYEFSEIVFDKKLKSIVSFDENTPEVTIDYSEFNELI